MERMIEARKVHACSTCKGEILKRDYYHLYEWKVPVYDADSKQIGIEYMREKMCVHCKIQHDQEMKELEKLNNEAGCSMWEHRYP